MLGRGPIGTRGQVYYVCRLNSHLYCAESSSNFDKMMGDFWLQFHTMEADGATAPLCIMHLRKIFHLKLIFNGSHEYYEYIWQNSKSQVTKMIPSLASMTVICFVSTGLQSSAGKVRALGMSLLPFYLTNEIVTTQWPPTLPTLSTSLGTRRTCEVVFYLLHLFWNGPITTVNLIYGRFDLRSSLKLPDQFTDVSIA